ncbi:MAG: hypothetical protein WAR83_05090 [Flavobacteriales bacterium]
MDFVYPNVMELAGIDLGNIMDLISHPYENDQCIDPSRSAQ